METSITQRLKEIRKRENLTQLEFAEQLGVSRSYIAGVERGAREINTQILKLLKEKYKVSVDWLLFGEELGDINFLLSNFKDSLHVYMCSLTQYINELNRKVTVKDENNKEIEIELNNLLPFKNWYQLAHKIEVLEVKISRKIIYRDTDINKLSNSEIKNISENIKMYCDLVSNLYDYITAQTAYPIEKHIPNILIETLEYYNGHLAE